MLTARNLLTYLRALRKRRSAKQLVKATGQSIKTVRRALIDLRRLGFDVGEQAEKFGRKTYQVDDPGSQLDRLTK